MGWLERWTTAWAARRASRADGTTTSLSGVDANTPEASTERAVVMNDDDPVRRPPGHPEGDGMAGDPALRQPDEADDGEGLRDANGAAASGTLVARAWPLLQRYDRARDVGALLAVADLLDQDPNGEVWRFRHDPGMQAMMERWAHDGAVAGVAFASAFGLMPHVRAGHRVRFEDVHEPWVDGFFDRQDVLARALAAPRPDPQDVRDVLMDGARPNDALWSPLPAEALGTVPAAWLEAVQGYGTDGRTVGDAMLAALTGAAGAPGVSDALDGARWATDPAGVDAWVSVADALRLDGFRSTALVERLTTLRTTGDAPPAILDGWRRIADAFTGPVPSRAPSALDQALATTLPAPLFWSEDRDDEREALHGQVRTLVLQGADPRSIPDAVLAFRQAADRAFLEHHATHESALEHAREPDEQNDVDEGRWDGTINRARWGQEAALDGLLLAHTVLGQPFLLSSSQRWALQRWRPVEALQHLDLAEQDRAMALMQAFRRHGRLVDEDRPYGLSVDWPGVDQVRTLMVQGRVRSGEVEALLNDPVTEWLPGLKPVVERLVLEHGLEQAEIVAAPRAERSRTRL